MKKIFPVFLLTAIICLFSGCVLVVPEYTMYFCNDTDNTVYDWYLKNDNGTKYIISEDYCVVPPKHYSSKSGLPEDYYQVWFCIFSAGGRDVYYYSENFVHLDSDTTYYLKLDDFYAGGPSWSINSLNGIIEEPKFTLVDSQGNEYLLKTEIINK